MRVNSNTQLPAPSSQLPAPSSQLIRSEQQAQRSQSQTPIHKSQVLPPYVISTGPSVRLVRAWWSKYSVPEAMRGAQFEGERSLRFLVSNAKPQILRSKLQGRKGKGNLENHRRLSASFFHALVLSGEAYGSYNRIWCLRN